MIKKYIIYLGLNDKITKTRICGDDKQVLTMIKTKVGDCTCTFTQGVYTYIDGTTCIEDTAKIELLDFNNNININLIIQELGILFNQESIAIEYEEVKSDLIFIK